MNKCTCSNISRKLFPFISVAFLSSAQYKLNLCLIYYKYKHEEINKAYEDINNKFKEVNDKYMMALNVKRESDKNINRNRYSFYTGMNKENFYMSCDNIVCFDYGVPYIFIPMEDNKKNYESKLSKSKKLKIIKENDVMSMISQIVSVIIRDEEKIELTRQNEDYFLLEDNGSVKKYFKNNKK